MSRVEVQRVRDDLLAEQRELDRIVSVLSPAELKAPSPSVRWTVADQIAHLGYFDRAASIAITDPDAFRPMVQGILDAQERGGDVAVDDFTLGSYRELGLDDLLERWRADRHALAEACARLANDDRIDWYGPAMGSKSFLTARLMECWAHGCDVATAVGASLPSTDRLAHIARLGFLTRGWSYVNRGLDIPPEPMLLRLEAPTGGDTWTFGDDSASEFVHGRAEDFCLVVTQRRHVDDTDLVATPRAREWLLIAQAFAGGPTNGPAAASA